MKSRQTKFALPASAVKAIGVLAQRWGLTDYNRVVARALEEAVGRQSITFDAIKRDPVFGPYAEIVRGTAHETATKRK